MLLPTRARGLEEVVQDLQGHLYHLIHPHHPLQRHPQVSGTSLHHNDIFLSIEMYSVMLE